ncbi:MAG: pseudaminic acid synthase [Pseudomonadota bacterium]
MRKFAINGRAIGPGDPPYIVAEMSANHNGDIARAFAIIDMAAEAGADAVKMQSYTPDTITIDHDGPGFRISGGLWDGETLYSLYRKAFTPFEWHAPLFAHAARRGVTLFSAPFDPSAVDLLESLGNPAYKIASLELVDLPLIARVARTGKPIVMSTGTASLGDIEAALSTARGAGARDIALLYCVSGYPTPVEEINLNTMVDMARRFDATVGLSDHSMGVTVAIAATALGAAIIEKHVTLARADGGPDSSFSLEPQELAALVRETRAAHAALGQVGYELKPSETANAQFKRSLYAVADIAAGETLTPANVRSIRPGFGLAPRHLPDVLGRAARQAIARGTPLSWDLVADK